ncbi:MAG: hypothetical protein O2968_00170 [Acidobacteria bacterium]|nr:hypothetical protein [Acidobacteriota bacterium]
MHSRPRATRAAVLTIAILAALPAGSETTRRWEQTSFEDFSAGQAESISIRGDGKLMLAPRLEERFEPPSTYIWTLAEDSQGNVFAGGGPGAGVFRIGADGRKSTFFERDDVEVHALAIDANDNVYAATSPQGKVYKIDPSGGYEVFFDPAAAYIWDLEFDAVGNLFVATGDEGKIFRVTPDGTGAIYFETGETHVRSLLFDGQGRLIVGTDPSALILRVSPGESGPFGFVLYQSENKEITALVLGKDGSIYAAAAGSRTVARPVTRVRRLTTVTRPAATVTPAPEGPPNVPGQATPQQTTPQSTPATALRLTGGSDVYRILPDGETRTVWASDTDIVYALGLDSDGKVLVGTGDQGRLFRVESETLETLVLTTASEQITALFPLRSGGVLLATSNAGKIYQLGPELAAAGTFESDVLDAERFTRWGRIELDPRPASHGVVAFATRSGNLESPSSNWSEWADVVSESEAVRSASPAARFLQWRATFSGQGSESPLLDGVRAYYRPKNVRPVITHMAATPPNYSFPESKPPSAAPRNLLLPPLGETTPRRTRTSAQPSPQPMLPAQGRVGLRWVTEDENGDDLVYSLEIRGEGEENWKLLEEKVENQYYDWDATSYADGLYRVRVTASDSPANPPSDAQSFSEISEPFAIDNTAPAISELRAEFAGATLRVRFIGADSASMIEKAEYSLDGGDWTPMLPSTRLFDAKELSFDFETAQVEAGEHTVAVRVYDRFDNITTDKVVVR